MNNRFMSSFSSFPLEVYVAVSHRSSSSSSSSSSTVLFGGAVDDSSDSNDDETTKESSSPKQKKEIISEINLPDDSEYTSNIDWDSEWKKVVQNQGAQVDRPGKDFYKSDAEIAAIRAANKARERAVKIASKAPSMPSFNTLKGDWKVSWFLGMREESV